jgi:hypothetical protein
MKTIAKLAVMGTLVLNLGTAAYADCNNDTGTEPYWGLALAQR